jgi:probable rRNA maturation factor
MNVLVVNQTPERAPRRWLERWLSALTRRHLKKRQKFNAREVVVVLVSPDEMRKMNNLYRSHDYATDVLSFAGPDSQTLGELVVCPEVLREQCLRTGLTFRGELGYMLVHGVLHLVGYDHEKSSDAKVMFALQDKIFASLVKSVGLR